ncbi:MAG: TIGR01458 family HAD-type hydrolase [Candidatus Marinimicrobia bacterium]|jgi:HAD superfamily hydrolase (TIGR01458 family)|nr:TIGR01458 family HAD-type hydrolase [Candidatus Neomarinimicrobiota bacterium]|tara:strand:+ start:513 stop:1292 length:780 start_codon:yes stop_codon:yes gene_type:complete
MIEKIKNAKGFLFDLDGVFIQSGRSLPGAQETIKILQEREIPFRFLTNTTTKSRNTLHMSLLELGIKCEQEHIFSAGYSGIKTIIEMGYPTCYLYISDDLKRDYGIFKLDVNNPEIVVIGDYEKWNFELLNQAFNYVINGAQILALHMGKYYKVDSGLRLDAGAIVKALEYATGEKATVIGKPNVSFFKSALDDINLNPSDVVMVGDDLYNDIYGAQRLKIPGILVKTGKYHSGMLESSNIKPDGLIDSIEDIAKIISN